jgi:hypothetical protein
MMRQTKVIISRKFLLLSGVKKHKEEKILLVLKFRSLESQQGFPGRVEITKEGTLRSILKTHWK